jgi:hypothetical protein
MIGMPVIPELRLIYKTLQATKQIRSAADGCIQAVPKRKIHAPAGTLCVDL